MGWVLNASSEVNDLSEYPKIIAIAVILSFLSVAIVGCRLWIRYTSRGLAKDDYMAALAMIFALIYSALTIAQTRYGLGLPIKLRPNADLISYTRVNFAGRPFYQLGISFFKIALLISYLRLLNRTDQKTYRIAICVCAWVIFLAHLGCTFSLVFACTPVDKSWNPLKAGTCLPAGPSFTGYAIVTIVSDVIVAIIPLPILLKLNVRLGQKLGLCGIFLLGLFTTLCSIFRYTQIGRIQNGDGNSTMLVLWGTIEFNVGNVVSSLPFLAPVLKRKAREYRSKSRSNSYGSQRGKSNFTRSKSAHTKSNFTHSGLNKSGEHEQFSLGKLRGRASVTVDHSGFQKLQEGRNNSEERILGDAGITGVSGDGPNGDNSNGIMKTVAYNVRVDEVGDAGDMVDMDDLRGHSLERHMSKGSKDSKERKRSL